MSMNHVDRVAAAFTFSHSVVDHVIVDVQSLCPEDADGRREAVVESAALKVGVVS